MRLYPPYKKWHVEIENIESYRSYLEKNIEFFHTNKYAILEGKLNSNGFFVRRIKFTKNSARPHIKGVISTSENGKNFLTLTLESPNYLMYIPTGFAIIAIITAIAQMNPAVLYAIPIFYIWFYIGGFVLHSLEVGNTEIELKKLYSAAKEE